LVESFAIDRIGRSPATFDQAKLEWICSQHIQASPQTSLIDRAEEQLAGAGLLPGGWDETTRRWAAGLAELVRPYLSHYAQIPEICRPVFFHGGAPDTEGARSVLLEPAARQVVAALAEVAGARPPVDVDAWREAKGALRERSGAKGKALFRPLRVSVTGLESGPELDLLVPLAESGHALFPDRISSIGQRARRSLDWLDGA
jgi:glutamyl/glutaminyl-tRNA synthetase